MRLAAALSAALAAVAAVAAVAAPEKPAPPQEPAQAPQESAPAALGFRQAPGRMPAGRVHRYARTDADGAPSELALFLAGDSRYEALRWRAGSPGATLFVVEVAWEVASTTSLERWRVDERGERALEAELELASDHTRLVARLDGRETTCELARVPWDSPELDFATLGVALRFLADPRGEVELEVVRARGPRGAELADAGPARLAYVGEESRAGLDCRLYSLAGPGLEHGDASLWAARGDEAFLAGLELAAEPGGRPVRLEWQRNETMSPAEWDALVRACACAGRQER